MSPHKFESTPKISKMFGRRMELLYTEVIMRSSLPIKNSPSVALASRHLTYFMLFHTSTTSLILRRATEAIERFFRFDAVPKHVSYIKTKPLQCSRDINGDIVAAGV